MCVPRDAERVRGLARGRPPVRVRAARAAPPRERGRDQVEETPGRGRFLGRPGGTRVVGGVGGVRVGVASRGARLLRVLRGPVAGDPLAPLALVLAHPTHRLRGRFDDGPPARDAPPRPEGVLHVRGGIRPFAATGCVRGGVGVGRGAHRLVRAAPRPILERAGEAVHEPRPERGGGRGRDTARGSLRSLVLRGDPSFALILRLLLFLAPSRGFGMFVAVAEEGAVLVPPRVRAPALAPAPEPPEPQPELARAGLPRAAHERRDGRRLELLDDPRGGVAFRRVGDGRADDAGFPVHRARDLPRDGGEVALHRAHPRAQSQVGVVLVRVEAADVDARERDAPRGSPRDDEQRREVRRVRRLRRKRRQRRRPAFRRAERLGKGRFLPGVLLLRVRV